MKGKWPQLMIKVVKIEKEKKKEKKGRARKEKTVNGLSSGLIS